MYLLLSCTYCKPIKLKVRSAMRIDSVEPLIDGVPDHCDAAWGIAPLSSFCSQVTFVKSRRHLEKLIPDGFATEVMLHYGK